MRTSKLNFKAIISALAFSFIGMFFTLSVNAQAPGGMQMQTPEQRADTLTSKMKTALMLSDEQLPQVQSVNLKYAQKMDSLYNAPGERTEKMPVMQSMQQDKTAELKTILTPDQYTKYQAMVKEMMDRAKAMHHS